MNTLKSILTTIFFLGGITFAQEETQAPAWSGEFSTDITLGDTVSLPHHIQEFLIVVKDGNLHRICLKAT